jgi:small-conductance mechanosensitive channel
MALWLLLSASTLASQTILIDNRPLWEVRSGRAEFSATERAEDIRQSILHFAEDSRRSLLDVRDVHLDTESILLLSRTFIFSVSEEDARLEGRPRKELYAERKQLTLQAIQRYRSEHSLQKLLQSGGVALAAMLLALGAVFALYWLYHRIVGLIKTLKPGSRLATICLAFESWIAFLLRLAFFTVGLSICFSLASYALGLFPATMGISQLVADQAWKLFTSFAASILAYLPNLFVLFLVGSFTYICIRAAKVLAHAVAKGSLVVHGFHREWASPTYDLLKILLILFGLVVAFPYLPGGDSQALKGASIFIGVLVSLGSGSAMGNVIAGVILTYMRPFKVGDRVQIADTTGDVVEKSLLVTRVRTIKNVEVILPNNAVLGAHILNYSANARKRGLILNTTITLGYDAPWRRVHELLIQAALRTAGIKSSPSPFVLQTSLNDFHISYEINAYTDEASRMAELYSDLHKHIQEEFNHAGVEIMSPSYLALRDGNASTTPKQ